MNLSYLPANQTWAFTFGGGLVRMDGAPMFFQARDEAVCEASEHGLGVNDDGSLYIADADLHSRERLQILA